MKKCVACGGENLVPVDLTTQSLDGKGWLQEVYCLACVDCKFANMYVHKKTT